MPSLITPASFPAGYTDVMGFLLARRHRLAGLLLLLITSAVFLSAFFVFDVSVTAAVIGVLITLACQYHGLIGSDRFGPPDAVTMVRAGLLGVIAAASFYHLPVLGLNWLLTSLATTMLLLDLLDGYLARRFDAATPSGAHYDESTDAHTILVLSIMAALYVGWWALLIGLLRPLFVAIRARRQAWKAPLPPSPLRKTVAATQGAFMVAALAPPFFGSLLAGYLFIGSALGLLVISFARDIYTLERQARTMDPSISERRRTHRAPQLSPEPIKQHQGILTHTKAP